MNQMIRSSLCGFAVAACLSTGSLAFAAPSISNSSFEVDPIAAFPTYRTITDWDGAGGLGVNDQNGPFWDNGSITSGTKCAFIQEVRSLTQNVPGFEAGKKYDFSIRVNARAATALKPRIKVSVGDTVIIAPTQVSQVGTEGSAGTGSPFWTLSATFTSPGDGSFPLKIENTEASGDNTVLIDEVQIVDHVAAASNWTNFR